MAFKTDFSDFSITTTRASIATVAGTLKLWQAADNTVTDTPIIIQRFQEENCKTYVEGSTPDELAQRVKAKLKEQVQGFINYYKTEQKNLNTITPAFTAMIKSIDGELVR